jgi:hypothetical protein
MDNVLGCLFGSDVKATPRHDSSQNGHHNMTRLRLKPPSRTSKTSIHTAFLKSTQIPTMHAARTSRPPTRHALFTGSTTFGITRVALLDFSSDDAAERQKRRSKDYSSSGAIHQPLASLARPHEPVHCIFRHRGCDGSPPTSALAIVLLIAVMALPCHFIVLYLPSPRLHV